MDENSREGVEKVLGEPFGLELTEDMLKTRRNLLLIGAISVFVFAADLRIDSSSAGQISALGGVALRGLTHQNFAAALALVLLYLVIHFSWSSVDLMAEFRLRLTGSRVAHQTGMFFGSEHVDYPPDPRQSTLYQWWRGRTAGFQGIEHTAVLLDSAGKKYLAAIDELKNEPVGLTSLYITQVSQAASEVQSVIGRLKNDLERVEKVVTSSRVPVSLARFDRAYLFFARAQNLKWLLMDFAVPVGVGIAGFWAAARMFVDQV